MAFKPTIDLSKLQQEQRHTMLIDGHKILLLWHQEQVHAIQAQCPHLKLSLAKGTLTEDCTIICPFHKSEFNIKTGDTKCWSPWPPVIGPVLGKISKEKHLQVYKTKVDNGTIFVDTQS